jgi:hypothetical protein
LDEYGVGDIDDVEFEATRCCGFENEVGDGGITRFMVGRLLQEIKDGCDTYGTRRFGNEHYIIAT